MGKLRTNHRQSDVNIHPTAIIHPNAEIDSGVEIGPFTTIAENVYIGKDTKVGSHVVIDKWTTIGRSCEIFQFSSIGAPPQDVQYKGEKTEVIIGDSNIVREFVTIHRATVKEERKTVIGNNNLFMAYVHIAHDCKIGNNTIMANASTLGGHVTIEDHAIVGGFVAVHQFVRIGAYCLIGGVSAVSKDIPPYILAVGNRATLFGLNKVGLKRHGFSAKDLSELKKAYNMLFRSSDTLGDSIEKLKAELPESVVAKHLINFIRSAKRGVARDSGRKKKSSETHERN